MRLGKFTGKVYEEKDVSTMEECGVCISKEQSMDENFIQNHHLEDLKDCIKCFGCPESRK